MSDILFCFTCSEECAARIAAANKVEDYKGGYRFVENNDDIVGVVVEDIDYVICRHRWNPATRTAYLNMEACIFRLKDDPDYELGK